MLSDDELRQILDHLRGNEQRSVAVNLGEESGEAVIIKFREMGYTGPILVMTAETAPARLQIALAKGGTAVLQKPYTADQVRSAISGALGAVGRLIEEPLFSTMGTDPAFMPLVEKYVTQVRLMAVEHRKAVKSENLKTARNICQSLKGTGSGDGFAIQTDAATAALKSLDASFSVAESVNDLYRLNSLCARLSDAKPE